MSSIVLRTLLRDPDVARFADQRYSSHPIARALRRLDDDFYDDWPLSVSQRRHPPFWTSDDVIGKQVVDAMNKITDFAQEIDQLTHDVTPRLGGGDLLMKRTGDGSLQLALDVKDYKPEDIKINLVDNHLVIEARNESSGENSYHKSEFKRWFKLPENCKLEEIKSNLTKDNKLLISLPSTKPAIEQTKVRSIPINVDQREAVENKKTEAGDQGQNNKCQDEKCQKKN